MQCFDVYDSHVRRGLPFDDTVGIWVGDKPLLFSKTLLFCGMATFGDRLVNVDLDITQRNADNPFNIRLTAPKHNQWIGDNSYAVVRLRQYIERDAVVSLEPEGKSDASILMTGKEEKYLGSMSTDGYETYFCALLHMKYRSALVLTIKHTVRRSPGLLARLKGARAQEVTSEKSLRIFFDGNDVAVTRL